MSRPQFVKDSSIETYHQIRDEGLLGTDQDKVYKYILANPDSTDREIADGFGCIPNRVRPRRKELVNMNLVQMHAKRVCEITGRKAYSWRITLKPDLEMARRVKCAIKVRCPHCEGKGYTLDYGTQN
jgi:hypothetical protein